MFLTSFIKYVCFLVLINSLVFIRSALAQVSPCPEIFSYVYDNGETVVGRITVPNPSYGTHKLEINMSLRAQLKTNYFGKIEIFNSDNLQSILASGANLDYKVMFPLQNPLPKVMSIIFNGREICRGPPDSALNPGEYLTNINLHHKIQAKLTTQFQTNFNNFQDIFNQSRPSEPINIQNIPSQNVYQNMPVTNIFNTGNKPNQEPSIVYNTQPWNDINNNNQNSNPPKQEMQWNYPNVPNYQDTNIQNTPRTTTTTRQWTTERWTPPRTTTERWIPPRTTTERWIPPRTTTERWTTPRTTTQEWTTPRTTTRTPSVYNDNNNAVCGVSAVQTISLIYYGDTTNPGEWPWLIAIFRKMQGGVSYICTGTLLSGTMAITAAHCTFDKVSNAGKQFGTDTFVLRLGAHNIQNWEDDNGKVRGVRDIIYPPNFNMKQVTDVDIAVLVMNREIEFTTLIRPICLWRGPNILSRINASVVAWGRDENQNIAVPEPRLTTVPIVSQQQCRESNDAFKILLNEYKFCAGNRDGSGPCNGDSGGGLYVYRNNRFELKGIVSTSLSNPGTRACDLSHYVLYADVAKFSAWLRSIIGLN